MQNNFKKNAMKQVRKITCINNAGFVQKFKVVWNGGQTGWSDTYPNPQSRSIELAEYRVPANTEVWIEVDAVFGKKKKSGDHVIFSPESNDAAIYRTTGATLTYKIHFEN